jgi:hypothetical protein
MAFSKSSLPLLLGPFINSFITICESMLSASQDGLLREMLLSKYRLQIFDQLYIYTISNTSSFETTSFPGLQCEDEARHEEALVWAGQFCILIG